MKKKMKELIKTRRQKLLLLAIGILLFLSAGLFSYAFFNVNYHGLNTNVIKTCSLDISFKDNNPIRLLSNYPMEYNETLDFEPYIFYIKSNNSSCNLINYTLTMNSICDSCTQTDGLCSLDENTSCNCTNDYQLDPSIIAYYIKNTRTDEITQGVGIDDLNEVFILENNTTDTYEMKMWIDSSATEEDLYVYNEGEIVTNINGTYETKNYCGKLNVEAKIHENLDTSGANKPVLATGMIPVYYDGTIWRKADNNNGSSTYRWYSYASSGTTKGMWANAVTVDVSNTTIKNKYFNSDMSIKVTNGTEISMADINTMWVWIPRFTVNTGALSTQAYFESIRGEATGGVCNKITYTTESDCTLNSGTWTNNYLTPGAINVTYVNTSTAALDAFWWDEDSDGIEDVGEQKSGFWYGKFETSSDIECEATNHSAVGEGCNLTTIKPKIIPNVTSWTGAQVSTFFNASKNMEEANNMYGFVASEVDTHVSKNNEWGAVAYLTQSIYGRCSSSTSCTEVTKNNCQLYTTGIGGDTVSASSSRTTCTTVANQYNGAKGLLASTTGTIYGIYDMSGGAYDYVMGNYNNMSGYSVSGNSNSGFNGAVNVGGDILTTGVPFPESKYVNVYTGTSYTGHALMETAGWYSDYSSYFVNFSPWFTRGGNCDYTYKSGVFAFSLDSGYAANHTGSRFALVK